MEDFDFNTPISIEVIFDESDDETTPSIDDLISTKVSSNISSSNASHKVQFNNLQTAKLDSITLNLADTKLSKAVTKKHPLKENPINVKGNNDLLNTNKERNNSGNEHIQTVGRFNKYDPVNKTSVKHQKDLDMPSLEADSLIQEINNFVNRLEHSQCIENKTYNKQHQIEQNPDENSITSNEKDNSKVLSNNEANLTENNNFSNTFQNCLEYFNHKNININKNIKDNTKSTQLTLHNSVPPKKRRYPSNNEKKSPKTSSNEQNKPNKNNNSLHQEQNPIVIEIGPTNVIKDFYNAQINTYGVVPQLEDYNNFNATPAKLLTMISESMIYILNAYNTYIQFYKAGNHPELVTQARKTFMHIKLHFFGLSYGPVMNIIVPRENDIAFVKSFIDNTIKLAQTRMIKYSYPQVEPLYVELMTWVKQKKRNIETKTQHTVMNQKSHPLLKEILCKSQTLEFQLNRPPPPYRGPTMVNNTNTTVNRPQIFPIEPPSDRNLNVDQSYLKCHNIHREPCYGNVPNNTTQAPTQSGRDHHDSQHQNIIQRLKYIESFQAQQIQMNIFPPPLTYFNNEMNLPQNNRQWPIQSSNSPQNEAFASQSYCGNSRLENSQNNLQFQPGPVRLEQLHQTEQYGPEQIRSEQIRTDQNRPEPIRPEQVRAEKVRAEQIRQDWIPLEQLPRALPVMNNNHQPVEQVRSSISRDSGFMSPRDFNGTNDHQPCNMQEEPSTEITPLITHVTSLNANVTFIEEGPCCVCGKTTRKRCQGCYYSYYCTPDCQYLDWNNHTTICAAL